MKLDYIGDCGSIPVMGTNIMKWNTNIYGLVAIRIIITRGNVVANVRQYNKPNKQKYLKKIQLTKHFIENLLKIHWKLIANLLQIYWKFIENLLQIYWKLWKKLKIKEIKKKFKVKNRSNGKRTKNRVINDHHRWTRESFIKQKLRKLKKRTNKSRPLLKTPS